MSISRPKEFENRGIKLSLTPDGAKTLAKILGEGCPVKISCDGTEPISCPFQWTTGKYFTCYTCWKLWLEAFEQEEQ